MTVTGQVTYVGHRQWISQKLTEHNLDYIKQPHDGMSVYRKWEKQFEIDLSSINKQNPHYGKPKFVNPWHIYTDGSKLDMANNNACGAAAVLFNGGHPWGPNGTERAFHLGSDPTVHQTEMYGLKCAARMIVDF